MSQLNFQFAIYVVHADVVFSQFSAVRTASDIQCLVQFLSDNFGFISTLCIVASIFHAVVSSCHFVFIVIFVFVYDTSHAVFAVFTVNTVLTVSTFNSKTVFAVFTIKADGTIFTVDYNSGTIFTVYADFTVNTVFTIFTVFTNFDVIRQCICISLFTSCIIDILSNCQIIACCVGYSFTVAYCCYSVVTNYITFRICGEGVAVFNLISQTRQVDFRNCTSLVSTIAIVVFQCNGFICCIIRVRCSSFTCTVGLSWCNM